MKKPTYATLTEHFACLPDPRIDRTKLHSLHSLLKLLSLSGCIVTIDAMGCQREIAKTILDKKADSVFSLKGNQGTLHREVEEFFTFAEQAHFQGIPHDVHETVEKDHGRIETRRIVCTEAIDWFADRQNWAGLRSFIYVDAETIQGDNTMKERRFFISSLPGERAALFAHVIRSHWSVENQLHWNLDVTFREDQSRVRKDQGPQNFALLRHIALNLLKQDKTSKLGVKNKRLTCGWDERFLQKILGF